MYGYRQYGGGDESSADWISPRGRLAPPPPPWLYQRPPRYPVYRRFDPYPPGWYPPGHVQLYGRPYNHHPPPSPYYYDELFRSSSAHLPIPPPADYALGGGIRRPARRTQSSVQARSRRHPPPPVAVPFPQPGGKNKASVHSKLSSQPSYPRPSSQGLLGSGFASRFFNDRHTAADSSSGQRLTNQMLVKPGLHQFGGGDLSPESRKILVGLMRQEITVTEQRHSSSSMESLETGASPYQLGGPRYLETTERKLSKQSEEEESEARATYRIVSELLPRSTQLIHEAILESAGRPEVILEAGQLRKHSRDSSCTCYQCQEAGIRKHSSASLVLDENYNLAVPTGMKSIRGEWFTSSAIFKIGHIAADQGYFF